MKIDCNFLELYLITALKNVSNCLDRILSFTGIGKIFSYRLGEIFV